MRKGTIIVLFIGLGILEAGLITVITIFAVNDFSFQQIVTSSTPGNKPVEKEAERIEKDITGAFTDIEILCVTDHVIVKEADNNICHVEYTEDAYTQYVVTVEGGTLKIT